jgi:DNA-binding CsgD family transcriptional regulator
MVLRAVRDAPPAPDGQETLADFLLDGFAAMAEQRYADGVPLLRRAMAALTGGQSVTEEVTRHFMAVCVTGGLLFDNSVLDAVERRWAAEFRDRGAIASLLGALLYQAAWLTDSGQFSDAEIALAEAHTLADATGHSGHLRGYEAIELRLLAARGDEERTRALADRIAARSAGHGTGMETVHLHLTLAKLDLGTGDYRSALHHIRASGYEHEVLGMASVADVAEAAVRCDDRAAAESAIAAFTPLAEASGTLLILGLLARARALAGDDAAEPEYQRAIECLRRERVPLELARSHLVYGEWLRRQRRRREARDQLRTAFTMLDQMGAAAFAQRAANELRATGEHATSRKPGQREALTPQEEQIARLASTGASNQEIAARLFISAATVDYHLRKVYRKLGINSRVRLIHALNEDLAPRGPGRGRRAARRRGRRS